MGAGGMSKCQVSRLCVEIDERVNAFLPRPLEGTWPYLWLDATYLKVREGGRIVSRAVIMAVAVNEDGERGRWRFRAPGPPPGSVGPSEDEAEPSLHSAAIGARSCASSSTRVAMA